VPNAVDTASGRAAIAIPSSQQRSQTAAPVAVIRACTVEVHEPAERTQLHRVEVVESQLVAKEARKLENALRRNALGRAGPQLGHEQPGMVHIKIAMSCSVTG